MKIIFMGTPDFAVPAFKELAASRHDIITAYTQPPRPAGRGQKPKKSPIHELAEEYNIKVRTPETLKDKKVQEDFSNLRADVAVVVAYGLILPTEILSSCKYGCLNIHPSLLPRWRGASPIQRAIIAGDKETGICITRMDAGLDTGDILSVQKHPIKNDDTAGSLHYILAEEGAEQLLSVLDEIEQGKAKPAPQSEEGATYAKKINKTEGRIDWNLSASEIHNLIRGLSPWPGAFFTFGQENIKIIKAQYEENNSGAKPGTVIDDSLSIACGKGIIKPEILQRSGKKAMQAKEFLRGFKIASGTEF